MKIQFDRRDDIKSVGIDIHRHGILDAKTLIIINFWCYVILIKIGQVK